MEADYRYSRWVLKQYKKMNQVARAYHNKRAIEDTIELEAHTSIGFHIPQKVIISQ